MGEWRQQIAVIVGHANGAERRRWLSLRPQERADMRIRAKVGTMPSCVLRVKWLRKFPRKGQRIWVKAAGVYGVRWEEVIVDRVAPDFAFFYLSHI